MVGIVRSLGEAARHELLLEIICKRCNRVRQVEPMALVGRGRFGMGSTFDMIGERMRCRGKDLEGGGCGHRGALVRQIFQPSGPDDGGPDGGGNVVVVPELRRAQRVSTVEAAQGAAGGVWFRRWRGCQRKLQ